MIGLDFVLGGNIGEDFQFHLIHRKGDRWRKVTDQLFQVSSSTTDLPPSAASTVALCLPCSWRTAG